MTIMDVDVQNRIHVEDIGASDRFVLREIRSSDVGLLEQYASDKRVAFNSRAIPHPLPPGTMEAFVERSLAQKNPQSVWIIDGSDFGLSEVMGMIALKGLDREQSEIDFWVGPSFWGIGIAGGALRAIIKKNPLNSKMIFAEIFQDNIVAARAVMASGFNYIGEAETYSVARNVIAPTWTYMLKCHD